jgi:hypothetical protein
MSYATLDEKDPRISKNYCCPRVSGKKLTQNGQRVNFRDYACIEIEDSSLGTHFDCSSALRLLYPTKDLQSLLVSRGVVDHAAIDFNPGMGKEGCPAIADH